MSTRALVISGGGSKGAFAVGAIAWMLENLKDRENNPLLFHLIAGTSTGSLIAPAIGLHTLGEPGILGSLVHFYTNTTTEQVLTIKGPITVLTTNSLYGVEPLEGLIRAFYTPTRYDKLQASNVVQVIVTTVNMTTGYPEYFYVGKPMTNLPPGKTINRVTSYEQFVKAILASACEPVMMPLIEIPGRTGKFTDGGVNEIIPLDVALDFGVDELYGISLTTENRSGWDDENPTTPGVLMRLLSVLLDEIVANDIDIVKAKRPGILTALIRPTEDIEEKVGLPALSFDPMKMMKSYTYGRNCAKEYFRVHPLPV